MNEAFSIIGRMSFWGGLVGGAAIAVGATSVMLLRGPMNTPLLLKFWAAGAIIATLGWLVRLALTSR